MTAQLKAHLLCCATPFVIAAYLFVRLIPQGLRALQPVGSVGFADLKGGFHTKAGPFDPLVPLDFVELLKRFPGWEPIVELLKRLPPGSRIVELKEGILSDSLRESPQRSA